MLARSLPLSLSLLGYFRRTPAELSAAAFKFAFAMLVIAAAFGATYADTEALFSKSDLVGILVHGAVVSSVPLLGVLIALRSRIAANAALALVTIGCVFTAYAAHTELFYPENRAALIGICGVGAFALFVAFSIVDERRWGGALLSAAALAAIGVIVASALMGDDNVVVGQPAWLGAGSNIRSIEVSGNSQRVLRRLRVVGSQESLCRSTWG